MCQQMQSKIAQARQYSLSQQNSVKCFKELTRDRIIFTQTLFARNSDICQKKAIFFLDFPQA